VNVRLPAAIVGLSALSLAAVLGVASGRGRQAGPQPGGSLPIQGMSVAPPETPQVPPPLPAGPAPDLDLVFTSQVAGWIEPCG
jgi:hypothetical protein